MMHKRESSQTGSQNSGATLNHCSTCQEQQAKVVTSGLEIDLSLALEEVNFHKAQARVRPHHFLTEIALKNVQIVNCTDG